MKQTEFNQNKIMDKKPISISFANQKGGIGKSTLTILAASWLRYVRGLNVLVVDCDFPQNSIVELREREKKAVMKNDAYKLMLKDYPDVMSIEQMCEILSISTKTGYRILREGKICCLKVGRAYRIPKAHLFTFLCIGCGEAVTA